MDNLAHTLVGATLAETGLKRWTPLGTATLLIGANLPDVDGFISFAGEDTSLLFRRGWTHGVLAMGVLPWVLVGAMLLWDARVRRRRHPDAPPARLWPLVGLAYLSVLTHPALDWLNTYGVRLLMPFDGSWFYGDALFIIDPWLWLLMAAAAVLAHTRTRRGITFWAMLGLATSALVLVPDLAPAAAKVAWGVGLALILGLRLAAGAPVPLVERVAGVCAGGLLVYIGAMLVGTHVAERQAAVWLRARGFSVERVMAGPLPARPFARDVIALTPGQYLFVEVDWLAGERLRFGDPPLPREAPGPIVQAALAAPQVRGFRNWLRFPAWEVHRTDEGWRVVLLDVRYSRSRDTGIGIATVTLDRELRPVGR
ncbi:metal-dependent hydrolase [Archangium sp.]|uniref:metal-dependent hydrolase n=1 Tax=Archangium sp. TaxID=1872627 RepID=UPI002D5FFC15|nr:metal-dependent hydrolase [Archangium sp.]HYO58336.1 metal-dependent hydrolase [Archangium sp.]